MSFTCTTCACCKTSAHRVPCVSSLRWLRPPATTPKHEAKQQSMEHVMKHRGKQKTSFVVWFRFIKCYMHLMFALLHTIIHIMRFRTAP